MRLSTCSWVLCALLIAVQAHAGTEVGDYSGLPQDLAAAATAYDVAQFKSDRSELERLLADDYTLAGSSGNNETKAQSIADATSPDSKATYVAISQQVRKVWTDGAVLGGIVDAKGVSHGKAFTVHARFVDVWAKRDGRWQVIFTQIHNAT
jgi:hypothetical protein